MIGRTAGQRELIPRFERDLLGLETVPVGAAVAFVAARAPAPWLNQVLGLGLSEPADEAQLDELMEVYHRRDLADYEVVLPPTAAPADLPARLTQRGFRARRGADVWQRPAALPHGPGHAWVEPVTAETVDAWWRLHARLLRLDPRLGPYFTANFGAERWSLYLARDEGRPCGASFVYRHEGTAVIAGGVADGGDEAETLASLLAWSMRDGYQHGCERLATLSAPQGPDDPMPTILSEAGFELAYQRTHYRRDRGPVTRPVPAAEAAEPVAGAMTGSGPIGVQYGPQDARTVPLAA